MESPFNCNVCTKTFKNKVLLTKHFNKIHKKGKQLESNVCDANFHQDNALKTHTSINTRKKQLTCPDCKAVGLNRRCSSKYLKAKGEKCFKCDVCETIFSQSGLVKARRFKQERRFKCTECEAAFHKDSGLKRHKKIHTGDKPFKCKVCTVGFTQGSNLKRHMLTHSEERPFKCTLCGACFPRQERLKVHMLTHTGQKPFKCDLCDAAFSIESYLKRHKQRHAESYQAEDTPMTLWVDQTELHSLNQTG